MFARGIAWTPDARVVLQVQSGSGCQIDSRGCATDGPGEHGDNEDCTIRVPSSGRLTATQFDTERNFDYVTIGGARYEGTAGPDGVAVAAGSTFTWRSDGSVTNAGWTICLGETRRPHDATQPGPARSFARLSRRRARNFLTCMCSWLDTVVASHHAVPSANVGPHCSLIGYQSMSV